MPGISARHDSHILISNENALVLSESLDQNAVQAVVDVAIGNSFSDQCSEWRAAKWGISERFRIEMTKRKEKVSQDITREENSLRRTLREAIVGDVISVFP